ncbi:MAG TPA: hypothetical protein VGD84_11145 [Pseudonocardiaceae bacterium]
MTDVPDAVIESLAASVAGTFPVVLQRIPTTAVTEFGRGANKDSNAGVSDALRAVGPLVAYRIVPDLPELYPYHGTPSQDADALLRLPEPALADARARIASAGSGQ